MKTKHTPGPWYYVAYADAFMLQDGPYYEDNNILSFDESFGIIKGTIGKEIVEANAKLAAAAPDLLEALQVCYASLCTYGRHPLIEKQVESAIKKAIK